MSGLEPTIITRSHRHVLETIPGNRLHLLPPTNNDRPMMAATVDRGRRRLTGWARPDQWSYAREVARVLRSDQPRTAIVNNDPEIAVYLRRRFPSMKVIHWFHNLEVASDRFRRMFDADPGITSMAVSAYLARAVEHAYRMASGRVEVNLNGVDAAEYSVGERPDRVPVVGFLGRIAIEKGADILLDAAGLLADRGLPFALQIVGDTNWGERHSNPYIEGVDRRIAALRSRGIVVETPGHLSRAELPGALAASDIHVFPSRWDEPFGLALLEGMASGQPAIASATGGSPEVLGGSGTLFVREDPMALASAIEPLLIDRQMRVRLGALARRRAEELTWQANWERTCDLIGRRAARSPSGARTPDTLG